MKSLHLKQHLLALMVNRYLGIEKYGIHGEEILVQFPLEWSIFNLRSRARPKTLNEFASAL